jgi:hypothetical protein
VVRKDRSYAGVSDIDGRQRPGGLFVSKNVLYEKGIEQCDFSKYLAPWRVMNARADKAVFSEFGSIPDDHPRGRVSTCVGIGEGSVDQGDWPLAKERTLACSLTTS